MRSKVIISTKGTGQPQGPSSEFRTMVKTILASVAGGVEYDTVYPASYNQNSSAAASDASILSCILSSMRIEDARYHRY
jgi:hypothetical protein